MDLCVRLAALPIKPTAPHSSTTKQLSSSHNVVTTNKELRFSTAFLEDKRFPGLLWEKSNDSMTWHYHLTDGIRSHNIS